MLNVFSIILLYYCKVLDVGLAYLITCPSYPIDKFIRKIGEPYVRVLKPMGFTITVPGTE